MGRKDKPAPRKLGELLKGFLESLLGLMETSENILDLPEYFHKIYLLLRTSNKESQAENIRKLDDMFQIFVKHSKQLHPDDPEAQKNHLRKYHQEIILPSVYKIFGRVSPSIETGQNKDLDSDPTPYNHKRPE